MINFAMRPTSLFLWVIIWPYELLTIKKDRFWFIGKNALQLLGNGLFSGVVGSWWYGKWTWIDYNFFKVSLWLLLSTTSILNSQSCMELARLSTISSPTLL